MKRKESFNTAAKLYDEARPSYPDEAIEWIINETKISLNDDLLEIAPGTGQATAKFGKKGFNIHAVELGDKLAELLLVNCKDLNVTVDVSSFEDWESNNKYKMIYCATAFHWLDPNIKYEKCHNLLVEDGYLVLIWNNAATGINNEIIDQAYKMLFTYYPNKPQSTQPKSVDIMETQKTTTINELEDSGFFKFMNHYSVNWIQKQSKEITIKGFYSQSSYLSLNDKDKTELSLNLDKLFESLDEEVESEFITRVYIGKRL